MRTEAKRELLKDYLIKKYWIKENTSVNSKVIACDSSFYYIGMYGFWQNSAQFGGTHYFLNYKDTVVFIEYQDTLRWNTEIEKFLLTYETQLSNNNKVIIGKVENKITK